MSVQKEYVCERERDNNDKLERVCVACISKIEKRAEEIHEDS